MDVPKGGETKSDGHVSYGKGYGVRDDEGVVIKQKRTKEQNHRTHVIQLAA